MALKTTWHHIRRSPYQAFAAVLLIMQTFFVVSIFTFVILQSSEIIGYFESKPQVSAFFKDDAKQENIDALKDQLQATGKVAKIRYISKKDALKIYKEQNKNDPLLLELVTEDILPASLDISAKQIDDLVSISDMLKKSSFIADVVFQKDLVASLTKWTNAIRRIGIALMSIFAIDSVVIMMIIISIKISQRKDEIEIMRLIGATSWYIRWPFIYEGVIYGIVGALVGWIMSLGFAWYSRPYVVSFFGNIPIVYTSPLVLAKLLGAEVLFAMVLGAFASFFAVLRYLK